MAWLVLHVVSYIGAVVAFLFVTLSLGTRDGTGAH